MVSFGTKIGLNRSVFIVNILVREVGLVTVAVGQTTSQCRQKQVLCEFGLGRLISHKLLCPFVVWFAEANNRASSNSLFSCNRCF